MTREEMVERLELERLGGMPRWQVHPQAVGADPLPVLAARRRVLTAEYPDANTGITPADTRRRAA